jgi:hypothetical protein
MPQSILIFDFGKNEEAAQQARHKFEAWKQAFRLGDKAVLKFERKANEPSAAGEASGAAKSDEGGKGKTSAKKSAKKKSTAAEGDEIAAERADIRILIRLSFSDHEKLSHQRWVERIPSEEPFKSAKGETIRHSEASFSETSELFDSLD